MKESLFFQQGLRGCFISLICILLAIGAVSLSANYLYPENPYCGNMLGAGFPLMFICDNWRGGSPTGSWNKIDFVDVINGGILPGGFFVDFLFYFILVAMIWFTLSSLAHEGLNWMDLWWTTLISAGFITGFLCASAIFLPSYLNDVRSPFLQIRTSTPALPSQTPIGTISTISPTLTPITTINP